MKKIIIVLITIIFALLGLIVYLLNNDNQDLSHNNNTISNNTVVTSAVVDNEFEEMIKNNNLEYMRDYLYIDTELSKKYINTVNNNENIREYKKYLFDIFKLVIKNKKYMEEEFFFKSLESLRIYKVNLTKDEIEKRGAGAMYYHHPDNYIELYIDYDFAIYHELMHFLDFSFKEDQSAQALQHDGKIAFKNYNNIDQEDIMTFENDKYIVDKEELSFFVSNSKFIEEAGAEYLTAKYFTNNINTFKRGTRYMAILDYIFGEEKLNELIFSDNKKMWQLLLNNGYKLKECPNIMEDLNNTLDEIGTMYQEKTFILDLFINLYTNNKKDKNWYEDKIFIYILFAAADLDENMDYSKSKYEKLREIHNNSFEKFEFFKKYIEKVNNMETDYLYFINSNESKGELIIKEGKPYIHFSVFRNTNPPDGSNINGFLFIDYDFENDKVYGYKFYENKYKNQVM